MSGTLAVLQTGGPTAVLNASLAAILREAKHQPLFTGIIGLVQGVEGALYNRTLDLRALDDSTLERLSHTPAAALGASRYNVTDDDYAVMLSNLRTHDVRYLIAIGGDGTMHWLHKLAECSADEGYPLAVIGVPKTVDNDLAETDHTPGYGSAARFMALAARDTGLDLDAMATFDDVTILEAMGRDAGWLAAAASLLKQGEDDAPHLVYVPEAAFDEADFLNDVAHVHERLGHVFVVVGEGIRYGDGTPVGMTTDAQDPLGRPVYQRTAGAPQHLATLIHNQLELKARALRPGLIGRALSCCVSEVDRREAMQVGIDAVKLLALGHRGQMVALVRHAGDAYAWGTQPVPLAHVSGQTKTLPSHFFDAGTHQITDAFRRYALPLIGDVPPVVRLR